MGQGREAALIGAGIATCSLIGAGIGAGIVFGSLLLAFARNYLKQKELMQYTMLGFALTEAIGLLGLLMALLILFL